MSHRAKSDSLYRLVKTLDEGVLRALRVYKEQYGGESDQWKLIGYYWNLAEWSRKAEKAEWPDSKKLSQLKYRAHRWLMRALAVIGTYPNHELHHLIGEIRVGLDRGSHRETALLIDEAKQVALGRELFGELLQILDLEMQAIRIAYEVPERLKQFRENVRLEAEALEKIADFRRFRELRAALYEPLVAQYERDSTYQPELMEALESSEALSQPELCLSIRSRHEYHTLKYSLAIKRGDRPLAYSNCKALIALYSQSPWLRKENLERYITDLRSVVGLSARLGYSAEALDYLSKIEELGVEDPKVRALTLDKLIYAKFFVAEALGMREQAHDAIGLYLQGESLLKGRISLHQEIGIWLLCARHSILDGKMETAISFLDRIKAANTERRLDFQVHSRVLRLIILIGIGSKPVEVEEAADAALRFVKRKAVGMTLPVLVIRAVGKMARHHYDGDTFEALRTELLVNLSDMSKNPEHERDFDFFPYLDWASNLKNWDSDSV